MHPIHVLFGTESNNSADLADRTGRALEAAGMKAQVVDMGDFDPKKLADLHTLLVITSTYGNGDPPSNAEALHAWVMKKAPPMPQLRFAVCALGDKTYDRFCNCGKEFDKRLAELGATRITDRQDCDVDYEKPWKSWLDRVVPALKALAEVDAGSSAPVVAVDAVTIEKQESKPGTRRNPVAAKLKAKRVLCGQGSSKETLHVELAIPAEVHYEVGDSLGIWPSNDPALVDELLKVGPFDGDAKVVLRGAVHDSGRGGGSLTLREALLSRLDLAHVDPRLNEACGVGAIENAHVIDVVDAAEKPINAQQLAESLRPIAPRDYSIASSLRAHPGEAHFTIDVVRYELRGRKRGGVASTMFADRLQPGDAVPVYLHPAPHFRLPSDDTPIVMIGPGTGVAPFRAFLEERAARGARGKSWLFFGARNANYDFLYGDELQAMVKRGALAKLNCAFSRDQPEKRYVQHEMLCAAQELYAWIAGGAVVYVCGDAKRMAPDVHHCLAQIIAERGGVSTDVALEELGAMERDGRYRKDVY